MNLWILIVIKKNQAKEEPKAEPAKSEPVKPRTIKINK